MSIVVESPANTTTIVDTSSIPSSTTITVSPTNSLTIVVEAGVQPFECPLCFEEYNDGDNRPTTLPCGHSCCLIHMHSISYCCICRLPVPRHPRCTVNYALRDGAMLYHRLLKGCGASVVYLPPQPTTGGVTSSSSTAQPVSRDTSIAARTAVAAAGSTGHSIEEDERLARQLQASWEFVDRMRPTVPTSPAPAPTPPAPMAIRDGRLNAPPFQATSLAENGINRRMVAGHYSRQRKSCGHDCTPSSLPRCCGCMDRRPIQRGHSYPIYVDGEGWRNCGSRSDGYCPICK